MKSFRSFDLHQILLLPPDLQDWLPEGHLSRFVAEVVGELDLSEIYSGYSGDGRGLAAYHPQMMAGLLIYGYCAGIFSSRRIERATYEDVAFRFLSGDQHPDHDTIAAFRERHLEALKGLFLQVLQLCEQAGLVKLGHVALDGTKVKANASKHKAMSYDHLCKREQELAQQIAGLLAQASAIDAAEGSGPKPMMPDPETAKPDAKDQRNFTDPESKIMKDGATKGFEQAYNAQIVVDAERQIIVGHDLITQGNDKLQLASMLAQVEKNLGRKPIAASADAGYYSDDQLTDQRLEGIDLHVPPDRQRHNPPPPDNHPPSPPRMREADEAQPPETPKTRIAAMRIKLKTAAGHAIYRMRKAIVEPVFGQTKEARGFRRFSLRGQAKASGEWGLICTTHNLLKLWRSGWKLA